MPVFNPRSARRVWRLRNAGSALGGADWHVVRRADLLPEEEPLNVSFLRFHIAGWVRDPLLWPSLIDMCHAVWGEEHFNPTLMGKRWLEERLDDAFLHERLVILSKNVSASSGGSGGAGGPGAQGAAAGAGGKGTAGAAGAGAGAKGGSATSGGSNKSSDAPPKTPVKTWFRARLLDEEGQPMANEDYVLVDTDGAKRKGKLDSNGEVYSPPLLPVGNCTITFPNIHLNPLKKK